MRISRTSLTLSTSSESLWDLSNRQHFQCPIISNSIIVKQSQSLIQPGPTSSVPAEATAFSRMHQMTSELFRHPVLDIPKASTGVSDPKIVDQSPENRVNQLLKFRTHSGYLAQQNTSFITTLQLKRAHSCGMHVIGIINKNHKRSPITCLAQNAKSSKLKLKVTLPPAKPVA
jgi:hypothetical protein